MVSKFYFSDKLLPIPDNKPIVLEPVAMSGSKAEEQEIIEE